jgi:hypothetical protein
VLRSFAKIYRRRPCLGCQRIVSHSRFLQGSKQTTDAIAQPMKFQSF